MVFSYSIVRCAGLEGEVWMMREDARTAFIATCSPHSIEVRGCLGTWYHLVVTWLLAAYANSADTVAMSAVVAIPGWESASERVSFPFQTARSQWWRIHSGK